MTWWMLLILVSVTWLLWIVGAMVSLRIEVQAGKQTADAAVRVFPLIPTAPLLAFGIALALDKVIAPWGSRIIAALHVLFAAFAVLFIIGIRRRGRAARQVQPRSERT